MADGRPWPCVPQRSNQARCDDLKLRAGELTKGLPTPKRCSVMKDSPFSGLHCLYMLQIQNTHMYICIYIYIYTYIHIFIYTYIIYIYSVGYSKDMLGLGLSRTDRWRSSWQKDHQNGAIHWLIIILPYFAISYIP